ncbi:MAG: HlyD family type I secretion periplasmic adaptor subunit [Pseudomonadota bacterium]
MSAAGETAKEIGPVPLPDADFERVIRSGLWLLAAGFGGFLAWGIFAPLDEGVPAPGVVSVESKRKRIEHLTGGIVEKILVREGQQVRAGQPLIELNETQAKAALNAAQSQWRIAVATEARLNAEREGRRTFDFPTVLTAAQADPEVAGAMRAQSELFRSRRGALEGELSIIRESVRGLETQIQSLEQLLKGREKQVALFNEQLSSYKKLNSDGFISRNQLIETERQLAEVQTKQSEDLSNIAAVRARLAEFRMRGAQRQIEYRREVETQLADVQKDVATLGERHTSQRDVHQRLVLSAPVAGAVVDLAVHTIGGVVKPGERIMDVVPEGDELIVEAQVPPQYIDRVRAGLPADVHFDAYMDRADRPVVAGKVLVVSADALTDARSGASYYAMRVAVPGTELRKLGALQLQPGMQATVMVKTGERSLLVYLARPLLRRFSTALSER